MSSHQGVFRVGWLDLHLILSVMPRSILGGDVNNLMLSHLDYWGNVSNWKVIMARNGWEPSPVSYVVESQDHLINVVEDQLGLPISTLAYGPRRTDRRPA